MNSSNRGMNVLPKWSVLLVVLALLAVAPAQKKGGSAPAPAPHPSGGSKPAQAPHQAAPASRPGGSPNGAQNRGPGQSTSHPGGTSGNAAGNRGPGSNSNTRGPGSSTSHATPGANANKGTQTGGNKPGQNAGNKTGQNAGNKSGQNAGNKTGQNAGNKTGQNAGNKSGQNAGNKPGQNTGNKPGQQAGNKPGNAGANANRHQPTGSKTVALKGGGSATYRSNGQVRTVQAHGMTINRGMHGNTRIVSTHNGRTVVSNGRYGGYSQRAYYNHGGHAYVSRTYYRGGHYYAYGYRSYYYGGRPYYGYAPAYYYGPAYYGWAYNPWPAPVVYGWGWGGSPWYGYYGPYWAPYPVYPTAAFWLTDYLIAANLQAAYAAQAAAADNGNGEVLPGPLSADSDYQIASLFSSDPLVAANLEVAYGAYMLGAAAPAAKGATGLPDDVKKAISEEMKNEIEAEKNAAASGSKDTPSTDAIPAALDPKIRYFVVSSEEDLTTSDGVECSLTAGDVVYRTGDKPDDDNMVDATVKSSKKDECVMSVTVGVAVDDLQEMHNQLRIQMDAGLKELADKQGKNGLPAAPDTKTQAGEVPAPTPDTNVSSELTQQQKDAAQVEAEAKQQ